MNSETSNLRLFIKRAAIYKEGSHLACHNGSLKKTLKRSPGSVTIKDHSPPLTQRGRVHVVKHGQWAQYLDTQVFRQYITETSPYKSIPRFAPNI